LPKESLDPISLRRSTNFLRDHEPDATVRSESWCPRDQEVPGAEDLRSAPVLPVLPRLADAQLRRKPMARRIQELLLRDRGDEALTAAQSATLNDTATVLGPHPQTETVGPLTGDVAGLECALHDEVSPAPQRRNAWNVKRRAKIRA
jgi:hypothetical protein